MTDPIQRKSLADKQRAMKMRTQGLPRPKLTRTEALDALAAEIEAMPPGAEKAALLAKYLDAKGRRRITKVKHVTDRPKPTAEPADDDELALTPEELAEPVNLPCVCIRCKANYFFNGANDSLLCDSCHAKWTEQRQPSGVPVT